MAKSTSSSHQLREFLATAKGKSYTITIVTLLLILVLVFFAIIPAVQSILLQISQNEERLEALAEIDQKRETLRLLINKHEESLPIAVGLEKSLPYNLDQEGIVEDTVNYARQNNVDIVTERFVNLQGRSRLQQVNPDIDLLLVDGAIVNIAIQGNRANLRRFVSALEESRRIFSIKNVTLSKIDKRDSTNDSPFIMNLQAEVYFWNVNALSDA